MAIYHFSAKLVTRTSGRSAVGAAAYRSGQALQQEGIAGVLHDYTRKAGVAHSEIVAPIAAPTWVMDRAILWNHVDSMERRKDAQLARELEVALPIELSKSEQVELVREFSKSELVSRGMVVDFSVHHDNPQNPHAHLMITLREVGRDGFGDKQRDWNEKALLRHWREAWASVTNEHLAMAGHEARVDHRSHFERGIQLEPTRKIGIGVERQGDEQLPKYLAERVAEQARIARKNGERIIADPGLPFAELTYLRSTFFQRDVAKYLHTRTDSASQFELAMAKVMGSAQLVKLTEEGSSGARYTTREMIHLERQLLDQAATMKGRISHGVDDANRQAALQGSTLSDEQQRAFEHVMQRGGFSAVVGVAGSGKSTFLSAAREAWETQGYSVIGASLSGIAAENLQRSSGIPSRTLASYELAWKQGRESLSHKDVLIIDEAAMVGTRQMSRVISLAHQARAKVVLVGDPEQLQAIEAGSPFRGVLSQVGTVELTEVRRQKELWQREATRQLSTGNTSKALAGYELRNLVHAHSSDDSAREAVLSAWSRARHHEPEKTQLMMAYTRSDVAALNAAARELRKSKGELSNGETLETAKGLREFSRGDRIYFLRNDKGMDVKNGTLGSISEVKDGVLTVDVDGAEKRSVTVDSRFYPHLDHGYAATIHKSQGSTVDRSFVLASPHFDRHTTYVSLSRHRESAEMHFSTETFGNRDRLHEVLSRARPKELALDFIDARAANEIAGEETYVPRSEHALLSRFQQRIQSALQRRQAEPRQSQSDSLATEQSQSIHVPELATPPVERTRDIGIER